MTTGEPVTTGSGIVATSRSILLAASVAAALAGAASGADAQPERDVPHGGTPAVVPHHGDADGHPFHESMMERLDLTEAQTTAMRRIRTDYDTMTLDKTAAIRVGEVELAALLEDADPDLDAIEQKVRAIGALRTELMMGRVTALLKLRTILTRGQYRAFQNVLLERMESLAEGPVPFGH